jgi:lipid-A-disaccharide synthase
VDLLLTILPFEKEWYRARGFECVEYVGNPLAGKVFAQTERAQFRMENEIGAEEKLIALLPGSRRKEIERILPVMLDAAKAFSNVRNDVRFAIALAPSRGEDEISRIVKTSFGENSDRVSVISNATYDLLNASDAAVVTSGTATLETALIGTPQVIVYRTSAINYLLLKPLIGVESFGLANLIAGEKVYKELLQNDLNSKTLCFEMERLLETGVNKNLRQKGNEIRELIGNSDASQTAALRIADFLDHRQ